MKFETKHSILIALIYGIYCALMCIIFAPYNFISEAPGMKPIIMTFAIVSVLIFLILRMLPRTMNTTAYHAIVISELFFTPLVAALVIRVIHSDLDHDLLLYLSTFLIIPILPIACYVLWMLFNDLKARVNISAEHVKLEEDVVEKIFTIKNEKGKVIIEVSVDQIITFEANDNYVVTYYMDKEQVLKKSMHRISLKKIEELLAGIEANFLRVHKSYLINPAFISTVKGRSQAYKIEMNFLSTQIPVSRTFDISKIQS